MELEIFKRPIKVGDVVASYTRGSYKGIELYIVVGFTEKHVKCATFGSHGYSIKNQVCLVENAQQYFNEDQTNDYKETCKAFKI